MPKREKPPVTPERVYALRQQLRTASLMHQHAAAALDAEPGTVSVRDVLGDASGADLRDAYLYVRLWLATLYVVIESWNAAAFSDPQIDRQLRNLRRYRILNVLKGFRNFLFHPHESTRDQRAGDLLLAGVADGSIQDLRRLHETLVLYLDQLQRPVAVKQVSDG